jgi:hypothetical protein
MICCGIEFPDSLGKYGCPNCLGDKKARLSRYVTLQPQALLACDEVDPMQVSQHSSGQVIFENES